MDDEEGNLRPGACLDLTGFRPDFVLRALRERNVVLEGNLNPEPSIRRCIDKIRLPDGTFEFHCIAEEQATPAKEWG